MRSYGARLAKLEKALTPADNEIHIVIEYVDMDADGRPVKQRKWDDGSNVDYRRGLGAIAPIARVAPGLLEKLRDDQLEAVVTATGGDVAELYQEDDMKHDRRLAKLEDRVFAAQKSAMSRLDTAELRTFVDAFERMFTPGCDVSPEEDAVKARWLALVQEQLHPADPLQEKLAGRLWQSPPPALLEKLQDDTPAPSPTGVKSQSPGDAAATTGTLNTALPGDPPTETPWNYQMARWMYQDPPAGPALRKLRRMARAGAQADERRRNR